MKKKSSAQFLPDNSADINCCRNPNCDNYLQPAEHPYVKISQGVKNPNKKYQRIGNQSGVVLKCTSCGETLPIKSANALQEELERLRTQPNIDIDAAGCRNEECSNHGIPITAGKTFYSKFGTNKAGNPRYKCKECSKTFAVNTRPHIRQFKPHVNKLVFKALVNKSPVKRIADLADIDPKAVHDKIDFIYKQCVLFARNKEAQLPELLHGRKLHLSTDAQSHLVNWTWRRDKRNTQLQSIATACNDTGFVFASHLNYDPTIDQEEVEWTVAKNKEMFEEPAFRETARFWTEADYLKSIHKSRKNNSTRVAALSPTQSDILVTYLQSEDRLNVDDSFEMEDFLKIPDHGIQIHSEYTMLAHFLFISELTRNAKKINHYMDQDSGIRAAFKLGYKQWLQDKPQKRVDGFYVKFSKDLTIDEKQRFNREYEKVLDDYRQLNNLSETQAKLSIIDGNISRALELGKWKDRWVGHPVSSMNEPEKYICHLNDRGQHSSMQLAWMYLHASLHGIDRFFMQSRRMVSYLERPIMSASNSGNMWNGYNAYNPETIVKVIEIFRVHYNYCKKGDDGKTPAQRIGLSKGINDVEDILYFHPNANTLRNARER